MNGSVHALDNAGRRVSRERLTTTLIFAVLAHGLIILGVGFVALVPHRAGGPAVAVTLVRTASATPPEHPAYLAQADERGPGNTRSHEAAAPALGATDPFPNPGVALAAALASEAPGRAPPRTPTALAGSASEGPRTLVTTTARTRPVDTGEIALTGSERPLLFARLAVANDRSGHDAETDVALPQILSGRNPVKHATTTDTRASVFAPYLERWRERVETIGNSEFDRLIPARIVRGHLTLSVTLAADGSIRSLRIVQRSNYPELDAAALRIVRLAAPYPPLPAAIRRRVDVLSFAYRWEFIRGRGTGGSVGIGGG